MSAPSTTTSTTPTGPLLITGASGHLGRRVVELLLERGAGPLIATTRSPAKLADLAARGVDVRAGDFDDPAAMAAAFRGARRALLVSTDAVDRPGRRRDQQAAAVRALAAAGVDHIVYTSCPSPYDGSPVGVVPDHLATERAIEAAGTDYTILRNNLYAEVILYTLPQAVASGQLVDSKGDGRIAWVWRDDCARAAAAALAAPTTGRRVLDITGPAALTSAELAAIAADLTGRPVSHISIPRDAQIAGMIEHGLPAPVAALMASFDAGAAIGDLAATSANVEALTGTAPRTVRAFLEAHRAALG
jgi:NAD(P)H dehydrogenase (quinone)